MNPQRHRSYGVTSSYALHRARERAVWTHMSRRLTRSLRVIVQASRYLVQAAQARDRAPNCCRVWTRLSDPFFLGCRSEITTGQSTGTAVAQLHPKREPSAALIPGNTAAHGRIHRCSGLIMRQSEDARSRAQRHHLVSINLAAIRWQPRCAV